MKSQNSCVIGEFSRDKGVLFAMSHERGDNPIIMVRTEKTKKNSGYFYVMNRDDWSWRGYFRPSYTTLV